MSVLSPGSGILRVAGLLLMAILCVTFAATPQIYSETADAHTEVRQALAQAAKEHKRVLLDFGGNWCGDCQVLSIYLHDPGTRPSWRQIMSW